MIQPSFLASLDIPPYRAIRIVVWPNSHGFADYARNLRQLALTSCIYVQLRTTGLSLEICRDLSRWFSERSLVHDDEFVSEACASPSLLFSSLLSFSLSLQNHDHAVTRSQREICLKSCKGRSRAVSSMQKQRNPFSDSWYVGLVIRRGRSVCAINFLSKG